MNHTLSIIVVALNEVQHIARLKASIDGLSLSGGVTIETILVDGGSRDGTVEAARERGFSRIIVLPGASIPVCRNAGIKEAAGDWIAFVDADCELAENWLQEALPFLAAEEKIVAGWPAIPPNPGTWVQNAWKIHWLNKNPAMEDWHGRRAVRTGAYRLLTTRNALMTRAAAEALDGFDEKLTTGEDTDFFFRAYHRNITVLGVPSINAVHHGEPATLKAFYRQQLWHAQRSSYIRIMRETGRFSGGNAFLFSVLFLLGMLLAVAGAAGSLALSEPRLMLLIFPLLAVIAGPSLIITVRGHALKYMPALAVLYAIYGYTHVLDFIGLYRSKPSWKRTE